MFISIIKQDKKKHALLNCSTCLVEYSRLYTKPLTTKKFHFCSKECHNKAKSRGGILYHKERHNAKETHRVRKLHEFDEFKAQLEIVGFTYDDIVYHSQENHAPKMIYDRLKRDYEIYLLKKWTKQFIIRMLKLWGHTYDHSKYLQLPQEVRLQYKFSVDMSLQDIKDASKKRSKVGALKTHAIRRKNVNYTPQYTIDYWLSHGLSVEDAQNKLNVYKRSISPRCIEFWLKRGLSYDDAKQRISTNAVKGALAALKKCQKSSIERTVTSLLDNQNIQFTVQFRLTLQHDEKLYRHRMYVYDIYIPSRNLLIDCHGAYWHANPKTFKSGDVIRFPGRDIIVDDIWAADDHRLYIAKKNCYNYAVIWEFDDITTCLDRILELYNA